MTTQSQPLTPRVVLGVAAHPDDIDYYAGGTMHAFAQQGADVYYLVLTDGAKGSSDRSAVPEVLRDQRRNEQRRAAKVVGVKEVIFCDFPDGTLENTMDVKREIVKAIRRVKPDVLITFDPTVTYIAEESFINHPDHRAAGQAALDAAYPLARDHMSFPELLADGYEPHNTTTILLMAISQPATFAVDITNSLDAKFAALGEHASQLNVQELKNGIREKAAVDGKKFGYTYAEPFIRIDVA